MSGSNISRTAQLIGLWDKLHTLPGGAWLFSRMVGVMVPYTGSIGALVREIRPGYARVELRDRRRVRNHLDSVHAIALANVGEFAGGLAMSAAVPPNVRSILTRIEIDFLRKAREWVQAECTTAVPEVREPVDHRVTTIVRDRSGVEVARIIATWRLSLIPNAVGGRRNGRN